MAPLSHFPIPKLILILALLFLLVLPSPTFLSVNAHTTQQVLPNTHIFLGRKTLSAKTVLLKQHANDNEEEEEEAPTLHTKKKVSVPDEEEAQPMNTSEDESLNKNKNLEYYIKLLKSKTASAKYQANLTKIKLKKLNSTLKSTKSKQPPPSPANSIYDSDSDEDADFISQFRHLPKKFQQTFIPDLHRISTTSQNYLTKANNEMTKNIEPYVGNHLAPAISAGVILLPLFALSLIFNKVKAHFSLQRLIILTQVYLSIYFYTLCVSSLLTGLDPLRFFYATSQYTYVWVQVVQTLAYVFYLLLLTMYLVLVLSSETTLGQKGLGLAQNFVGFSVGLHYYVTVVHRMVLRQSPKTNWKVHGIYATCFLVICLFCRAGRRKKAYLVEGGEQCKIS